MLKPLLALASATLLAVGLPAAAQQPPLPALIRIVVPAAPGSSTDAFARAIANDLGTRTGRSIIVENKPGAGTMLGSAAVAKGPKDGSQLLINSTSLVSTAATMKSPPLDVVNDLVPVALLEQNPLVMAASVSSNIKTPAELVAAARAGSVTHGTTGVGSIAHIGQELFADAAKVPIRHVPYKGTALAVMDMASGVIDTVMATWTTVAPGVKSGRARLIGVSSLEPSAAFPNVPTLASVAPGFSLDLWLGIFAPAGTPPAVVQYLNHEINEISRSEKLREMYAADGGVPLQLTPEEIHARMRSDFATFKKLAVDKNITVE
ncbi:tripartite tricarboxylate transporter substrate binding protein [Pseudorhodoferax sp.]|uniref:tripartite tricarboxylate transporter substrate binding protein n=1 Tax=Pseudorhodoferax sp. TaxID=1993553 RepID=UPI0039E6BCEB